MTDWGLKDGVSNVADTPSFRIIIIKGQTKRTSKTEVLYQSS